MSDIPGAIPTVEVTGNGGRPALDRTEPQISAATAATLAAVEKGARTAAVHADRSAMRHRRAPTAARLRAGRRMAVDRAAPALDYEDHGQSTRSALAKPSDQIVLAGRLGPFRTALGPLAAEHGDRRSALASRVRRPSSGAARRHDRPHSHGVPPDIGGLVASLAKRWNPYSAPSAWSRAIAAGRRRSSATADRFSPRCGAASGWFGLDPGALWLGTKNIRQGATLIGELASPGARAAPARCPLPDGRTRSFRPAGRPRSAMGITAWPRLGQAAADDADLRVAGLGLLFFGVWLIQVLAAEDFWGGLAGRRLTSCRCACCSRYWPYPGADQLPIRVGRAASWREYLTIDFGSWPR